MTPDTIIMYCGTCDEVGQTPGTALTREEVKVVLSLIKNRWEFFADCPLCGSALYASRSLNDFA